MPYIKKERRSQLEPSSMPDTTGELNYVLTAVVRNYLRNNGCCYGTMNDIMGALESAKLEFYRRIVVPFEETKRKENGDVY